MSVQGFSILGIWKKKLWIQSEQVQQRGVHFCLTYPTQKCASLFSKNLSSQFLVELEIIEIFLSSRHYRE